MGSSSQSVMLLGQNSYSEKNCHMVSNITFCRSKLQLESELEKSTEKCGTEEKIVNKFLLQMSE